MARLPDSQSGHVGSTPAESMNDRPRDKWPYLLSIGVGLPLAGIWGHRYIPVRKRHRLRSFRFLGMHVVWTSYKRLAEEEMQ